MEAGARHVVNLVDSPGKPFFSAAQELRRHSVEERPLHHHRPSPTFIAVGLNSGAWQLYRYDLERPASDTGVENSPQLPPTLLCAEAHKDRVTDLQLDRDVDRLLLATASADSVARIWDVEAAKEVYSMELPESKRHLVNSLRAIRLHAQAGVCVTCASACLSLCQKHSAAATFLRFTVAMFFAAAVTSYSFTRRAATVSFTPGICAISNTLCSDLITTPDARSRVIMHAATRVMQLEQCG
eukprot:gnl/TRDRNA2_/TRDRNA2_168488_c1_seq1.p1 gnl/TRDRNA2_/TRDRNA2_168488_c1~~gnl/TRDRNA2_/TRDRNA2_168488_c1_seq1.p1  ORF type:complete len:241 (+),score=25.52 gnl/TRDRNA2_/TRDRNA2_168488_c1_seq1:41-763(+)